MRKANGDGSGNVKIMLKGFKNIYLDFTILFCALLCVGENRNAAHQLT